MMDLVKKGLLILARRKAISQIRQAGVNHQRVDLTYRTKAGQVIHREIRPYEVKPHRTSGTVMLYATDTKHGANNIHSFIKSNIIRAVPTDSEFKPQWEVNL